MVITYNSLKNELLNIRRDIVSLFALAASVQGSNGNSFSEWEQICAEIESRLSEEVIRVAVVGPIKSGKSTFINSLLKQDYLKRGAGVVTSIVTRIRRGSTLKAKLFFKSVEDINREIEDAMVLLPSIHRTAGFDIRRIEDRAALEQALEGLSGEERLASDTRNMNAVVLSSYMKGYERVSEMLGSDSPIREYEGEQIAHHKDFAGDDTLSVYLRDLQLEIEDGIDENVEIADCQGSDSPNPLHLAMIQDYLLLTHFIIYVISSRTGLRQADIKFLSMIRKMGIIDNMAFVVNFDFNEHDSVDDLTALVGKVSEELSLLKPNPPVYTLSALFNLFDREKRKEGQKGLSNKDRQRIAQWKTETALVALSDAETRRFEADFNAKITRERSVLLLKNHLERLSVIESGVEQWISMHRNLLERDAGEITDMREQFQRHQQQITQIKTLIKNTVDGSARQIESEIRNDTDRLFDSHSSEVIKNVLEFIRNYTVRSESFEEYLQASSFSNTLYRAFQEFKQALDTYIAEIFHPEVIRFVREEEKKIRRHFESVSGTYQSIAQTAFAEHHLSGFGVSLDPHPIELPDTEAIKQTAGIVLPSASASMRYSVRIRSEAILKLGVYSVIGLIRRLFKKAGQDQRDERRRALTDGIRRMKFETEKAMRFHFIDVRENIKFQYLLKLSDASANALCDALISRFQGYTADLSAILDKIGQNRIDRQQAAAVLDTMETKLKGIHEQTEHIRTLIPRVAAV